MLRTRASGHQPSWFWIPVRVLLVTGIFGLLGFAISLLLGIAGLLIGSKIRGTTADFTIAYRLIAPCCTAVIAAVVLVSSLVMEIRHYRQTQTLASIARSS